MTKRRPHLQNALDFDTLDHARLYKIAARCRDYVGSRGIRWQQPDMALRHGYRTYFGSPMSSLSASGICQPAPGDVKNMEYVFVMAACILRLQWACNNIDFEKRRGIVRQIQADLMTRFQRDGRWTGPWQDLARDEFAGYPFDAELQTLVDTRIMDESALFESAVRRYSELVRLLNEYGYPESESDMAVLADLCAIHASPVNVLGISEPLAARASALDATLQSSVPDHPVWNVVLNRYFPFEA